MKAKKKQTQDDSRQQQIADYCGLEVEDSRIGIDAWRNGQNPFEIKSLTKNKGVSTARQVHLSKVLKWKSQYWIIGKGPQDHDGWDMQVLYLAHPNDLNPFFSKCEAKITRYWTECHEVLDAARKAGISEEKLKLVETIMEVGTRLDDPCIPWKSVIEANCTSLPIDDPAMAQHQIDKFIVNRPIVNTMPTTSKSSSRLAKP